MIALLLVALLPFVATPGIWGALIAAAISAYGASKDKKATKKANAANQYYLNEALGYLGWPGMESYHPGPSKNELLAQSLYGSVKGITGAVSGKFIPKANEKQISSLVDQYYSGDATASAAAKAKLEGLVGADNFANALSGAESTYAQQKSVPTAYGMLGQRFDEAGKLMQQSASALTAGYQKANRAIAQTAAGAQGAIIRQGDRSLAQGKAQLAQSGLLNTTLSTQLGRATRADTSRQLTGLAGQLAPIRAAGQAQLGEAQARGFQGLANLQQNRAQMEMQLALQRINALLGVENVPGPGFLSSLGGGQGIAGLASMFGSSGGSAPPWYASPGGTNPPKSSGPGGYTGSYALGGYNQPAVGYGQSQTVSEQKLIDMWLGNY